MILKNELVKKIKEYFGLNIYETKVWLALLAKGVASAGEIAELSGVPRSRTYDVLESLEKQGFAIQKLGKPVRYIALKPAAVIEKLKNDALREAEERKNMLSRLSISNEYKELELLHKTGISPTRYSELSGFVKSNAISAYIRELVNGAEKEVIAIGSKEKTNPFSCLLEPQLQKKLRQRGVILKIDDTKKVGVDAQFLVVDGKQLLFMLADGNGIWIKSEIVGQALKQLFEFAWQAR